MYKKKIHTKNNFRALATNNNMIDLFDKNCITVLESIVYRKCISQMITN